MSKFLLLTKVFLKSGGNARVKDGKGKLAKTIGLWGIMALCFLPLASMFVGFAVSSYDSLAAIHQEGVILATGISIASIVIFVFGIFYVMSVFYFSKDIENLLPLPLKPSVILGAKFTTVLVYEYLTEALIFLPIAVTFGIKSGASIVYYIYGIIVFLTLPIIPLILDSLISILIMRFTSIGKNKDRFNTIAQMMGLFLAIGFNLIMQRLGQNSKNGNQMAKLLMEGNNSLVGTTSKAFPTSKIAVNSMLYSGEVRGLVNLLLFLAITIGLLAILLMIGEAFYLKGIIGISQSSSKRKKLSEGELEKNTVESSPVKSYLIKELRILFRTPIYFMNCVVMNFLWPVFLIIPAVTQPEVMRQVTQFKDIFSNNKIPTFALLIAFGVSMFIGFSNPTASTSISREGQNIYVNKYLPISYKSQIMAKVLSAFILNTVGIMMLVIIGIFVLNPPIYFIIQVIVLGILANLFTSFFGVFIDLNFPKLTWDTEQKAVKQNMNVFLNMIIGLAVGGATIFAFIKLNLSLWIAFLLIAIVYGILDIILYVVLNTKGQNLFARIE